MNIPGFTADASIYRMNEGYYMSGVMNSVNSEGVTLAGSCTCSDPTCANPTCSCSCPPPPDPCTHCASLPTLCARVRCFCTCAGGIPVPSHFGQCGFLCT